MRRIDIGSYLFSASGENKRFIVLGYKKAEKTPKFLNEVRSKIQRRKKTSVSTFWATLGFSDDAPIDWSGYIEFSGRGNKKFEGIIGEEIKQVKQCIPELKTEPGTITERFISFENIDFKFPDIFSMDQIPMLRLELMIAKDEGAVVFFQYHKDNDKAEYLEYIQPQPTKGNLVDERDRLTYLFKVIPPYQLEPVNGIPGHYRLNTILKEDPFIVKIITFKRTFDTLKAETTLDSTTIITNAKNELNKIIQNSDLPKEHRILIFNRTKNDFTEAKPTDIDTAKKTLLLIHGTFGDTEGSFGDLYGKKNKWMLEITDPDAPGCFEQVLSFDHPTLFYGAKENIEKMFELFDELNVITFLHEVDLMGTSQGGLLIQYLANLNQSRIKVGKAVLVASANGVGYFETGENISKFLSAMKWILKKLGKPHLAFISAIAQHSTDFLLKQEGFQIMTPGNEKLNEIINNRPVRADTEYLPIINDYDKSLMENNSRLLRFFKRLFGGLVDTGAKSMLGTYNDWVVGTKNQYLVPPEHCAIQNYNPFRFKEQMVKAIHGHTFEDSKAKDKIKKFLLGLPFEPVKELSSPDRFDAHCHIFGRNIITARILFLLLEDILNFLKEKSDFVKLSNVKVPEDNDNKSDDESGSTLINILHYFVFNKDSFHVLADLSDEYDKLKSNVNRYIPLMFDLEMTFRISYKNDDTKENTLLAENEFIKVFGDFIIEIDELVNRFETSGHVMFKDNYKEMEESINLLKAIKTGIQSLNLDNGELSNNVAKGYFDQIEELKILKNRYGNNIFPFLAVDPRREDMADLILDLVGPGKPFHGIKLYAPNGYSPTDPHLYDEETKFIGGTSLYRYCIENKIPIMVHCSDAGFSTFVEELDVLGHYREGTTIKFCDKPTRIKFTKNMPFKFDKAVRERASVLNHPTLWDIVLTKYADLTICFAHFGGDSVDWQTAIAGLIRGRDNVYTDLSCIRDKDFLEKVKKSYYDTNDKITNRIMYGSDFFFNMLSKIEFSDYYEHFTTTFDKEQLNDMNSNIPNRYLGI